MLTSPHARLCSDFRFVYPPSRAPHSHPPAPFPPLIRLLSAHRLAHPEGSLPDLAMMKPTASLEVVEVKQLAGPGEEKPGGCPAKAKKGELGKESEEEDEEEEEEDEEEEETSGKPPAAPGAAQKMPAPRRRE